jgi:hypothetical protein
MFRTKKPGLERETGLRLAMAIRCTRHEPHRDFWKLIDRPQPDLPAARAIGLEVRVALGGEPLDGRVMGFMTLKKFWKR